MTMLKNKDKELINLKKACRDLIEFIYKKYNTKKLTCKYLRRIDKLVNKEE